jgi:hypothetical protein
MNGKEKKTFRQRVGELFLKHKLRKLNRVASSIMTSLGHIQGAEHDSGGSGLIMESHGESHAIYATKNSAHRWNGAFYTKTFANLEDAEAWFRTMKDLDNVIRIFEASRDMNADGPQSQAFTGETL